MSNFIDIPPIAGVPEELIRILNERLRGMASTPAPQTQVIQKTQTIVEPSTAGDSVQGASALTTAGAIPKVGTAGTLAESALKDDGTKVTVTRQTDVGGIIRSTAATPPASGAGIEVYYNPATPLAVVQAYDRTGAAWEPIRIDGLTLKLNVNSGGLVTVGAGGLNNTGPYQTSGTPGVTGTIFLAKLTAGGTNGNVTVTNGIITAITNPT